MAKFDPKISTPQHDADSSFEMIELLSEDLDALVRAFDLITEVCEERLIDGEEKPAARIVLH